MYTLLVVNDSSNALSSLHDDDDDDEDEQSYALYRCDRPTQRCAVTTYRTARRDSKPFTAL